MTSLRMRIVAVAGLALLLLSTPMTFAQAPSVVNLFSIWVSLSLRGNSQQEIESQLRNMDPKTLAEVKERLRNTVIANLRLKKLREQYIQAIDKDDLRNVVSAIETEIRFAGLSNDNQMVLMIKDEFGIHLNNF